MSLSPARAFLVFARPKNVLSGSRRMLTTTTAHEEYPKEDYSSRIWRNALIASMLTVLAYKYAPEPGENTYLTRWIALYKTPRETWLDINARHTAQQQEASTHTILLSDAKKEVGHRYRYPQIVNQSSPFLNGVGM
ncbi:hypothetical protein JOM56_002334 [Amanita muscaria]